MIVRVLQTAAVLTALSVLPTAAFSQTGILNHNQAEFISSKGIFGYLALGVGLPLLRDHADGQSHMLRTVDSGLTTTLAAEILKRCLHVDHPEGSSENSFPSGHTTAAFAVAAAESSFHPREAPLWIAGAALIGDSRVTIHAHQPLDVFGGALLGWFGTRGELSTRRGILIAPLVSRDSHGRLSLSLKGKF